MAIHHLLSGEVVNLQALGRDDLDTQSIALFKSAQLEVIRLVLPAGRSMPMHAVAGEITLQCLQGSIAFETSAETQTVLAGQLLYLRGGEPHSLRALQDACVLLTIVLTPTAL